MASIAVPVINQFLKDLAVGGQMHFLLQGCAHTLDGPRSFTYVEYTSTKVDPYPNYFSRFRAEIGPSSQSETYIDTWRGAKESIATYRLYAADVLNGGCLWPIALPFYSRYVVAHSSACNYRCRSYPECS